MKFIHLTDTHLVEPGARLYGLDPRARLDAAITSINAEHGDAVCCMVTGDLAHWGAPAAYRALRESLANLAMPVHLLIGNHDNRAAFRAVVPETPVDAGGFVQFAFDTPQGRFVCLDTNEPGVSWGVFCARRAAWLDAQLQATAGPVFLFMHHPPFPVGIPSMDRISLRDCVPFSEALLPCRARIRHLFFGHLHRPVAGSWSGIPVSTVRGTSHQVALRMKEHDKVPGSHEPPGYAVVLADDTRVVVHMHDYADATGRFDL